MSNILHRHCHVTPTHAVSGDGIYIIDQHKNQYIDACGGAAVSNIGHNNQSVKAAIQEQLTTLPYAHSGFFTTSAAETLASKLCDFAPENFNHVYLVSGGSEAVESALKMARQYFWERGQTSKSLFIARKQSYHGNTLGALAVGGNQWRKVPFDPILMPSHHITAFYPYRFKQSDETIEAYSLRAANELEQKIIELGAENVAGFVAEPIVGATAGCIPANAIYFKRIREICDKHDVLLILDEVMCGVGRTGTFFAFEQDDIVPDMVTLAKGLAAGYQPIGAVMVNDKVYDALHSGSGFFQHGHTFMAHPAACAAAVATLDFIEANQLIERCRTKGIVLHELLHTALDNNPYVGDIRGRGLFVGIELVQDKLTKQAFPSSLQLDKQLKQKAMRNGLMIYPMSGTIDGKSGCHILLAPHYISTELELQTIVELLTVTIQQVTDEVLNVR